MATAKSPCPAKIPGPQRSNSSEGDTIMNSTHHGSTLCLFLAFGIVGCSADLGEDQGLGDIGQASQAITTLTLSGQVRTAAGQGIPGALVTRSGSSEGTVLTDAVAATRSRSRGLLLASRGKEWLHGHPGRREPQPGQDQQGREFHRLGQWVSSRGGAARAHPRGPAAQRPAGERPRAVSSGGGGAARVRRRAQDAQQPRRLERHPGARLPERREATNPALEGVLYVGNVKLPSFYKVRADILGTKLYPAYLQDLDATFTQNQAPGTIDPTCTPRTIRTASWAIRSPSRARLRHHRTRPESEPRGLGAFMPVGVAGTANTYTDFANQLRPYLTKVRSFYSGALNSNGRAYFVSNDIGEHFEWTWDAFGPQTSIFTASPGRMAKPAMPASRVDRTSATSAGRPRASPPRKRSSTTTIPSRGSTRTGRRPRCSSRT